MTKKISIYKYLQTKVIAGVLTGSDLSFYRKVCRWYSKTFHTPLHIVMDGKTLQWDDILHHYYEEQMEEIPFNAVFDIACKDYIPDLAQDLEDEDEAYAKALVDEQKRTIEAKKKRDAAKNKKTIKQHKNDINTENIKEKPSNIKLSFDDSDGL
jgi:hypothetical protein